ncbi:GNAT family N-acetyltransferase [Metallibacterium sp.]|uniref:GNAT family N-acetyltransferase n=1 Tax=Metallibacterium sp. TaxID=2940281 RepID=UPI0026073EE8|nr:GNAT family N-acetyltransferase [Metallibacterium sp.]
MSAESMHEHAGWLRSARLALRRFTSADIEFLHGLYADPAVARFLGGVKSRGECEIMLHERVLAYYDEHPGLGVWLTRARDSGAAVGLHLLNHIRGETHIQVGYVLATPYWGHGYATEMSLALLHYGFTVRGLQQITAITHLDNTASQRVLQKCGLQRRGERVLAHPSYGGQPLAWFELEAAEWARHAPPLHAEMRLERA